MLTADELEFIELGLGILLTSFVLCLFSSYILYAKSLFSSLVRYEKL